MENRTRRAAAGVETNNENGGLIRTRASAKSAQNNGSGLQQRPVLGDIGNQIQGRKNSGLEGKKAISKNNKPKTQLSKSIVPAQVKRDQEFMEIDNEEVVTKSKKQQKSKPSSNNNYNSVEQIGTHAQVQLSKQQILQEQQTSYHDNNVSKKPMPGVSLEIKMAPVVPEQYHDIDIDDLDYPEYCTEYVKDIYEYLHQVQKDHFVSPNYMELQEDITPRMRTILIDWLVEVHLKFKLLQETLYLSVSLIDRYLAKKNTNRQKLQLVGVAAMFIASKFEEIYAPEVADFVYITDDAYSREEILEMERDILNKINFRVATAYPLHFLRRASKVADADPKTHTLAKYLIELSLPNYECINFMPSMIAAAGLKLARMMLCLPDSWNDTLAYYTKYKDSELMSCVDKLFFLARDVKGSDFNSIYKKYGHSRYHKVSLLADEQIEYALNSNS